MQIELGPIDRVKPYDRNPRLNDAAVDAVAASLREFGWRQPVLASRLSVRQAQFNAAGWATTDLRHSRRVSRCPVLDETNGEPSQG
jgi:hypothetical protein